MSARRTQRSTGAGRATVKSTDRPEGKTHTMILNELSDLALAENDHATYNLLQWLVNEQVEEEATLNGVIAKLRLVGDDGYGQLMVDNELGAPVSAPA